MKTSVVTKLIPLVGIFTLLAGCNTVGKNVVASRDFLADPKTQAAARVLTEEAKAGATLVSCFVGAGSSIALVVEQQAGASGQSTTGIVYSASSKVCATLKGTPTGSVTAAGGEPVVTAAR